MSTEINLRTEPGRFQVRAKSSAILFVALTLLCSGAVAQQQIPEKHVTFYTTYGSLGIDGWEVPLKVWISEEPDFVRRLAAKAALGQLQDRAGLIDLSIEQEDRFVFRTHGFIADSESNEVVRFRFDADPEGTVFELRDADGRSRTDWNGLIDGTFVIPVEKANALLVAQESDQGWLTFSAVSEDHGGVGRVRLIGPAGLSVISDVDDTIKVTEIPAGEKAVLNNTFFKEFRTTPCMAKMYNAMDPDTAFHYVSGGPWQLYEPLREFLVSEQAGFPEGSFHMKDVRTNPFESESYGDIWSLIASGSQAVTFGQKVGQISALLRQFPERQFILIGDSGEKDPEVFAEIRRHFADQLAEIKIRDVVDAANETPDRLRGMTVILPDADPAGACRIR